MTNAYIFDALRTPRGKGKKEGSLHEITPIDLLLPLFKALEERNDLDTKQVDDVVLGCVTPLGEQGSDIAKIASLYAGWDQDIGGVTINRFCASGLDACNTAAMKVMSGMENMVVAGGVESMSRIPLGSDGGAWYMNPKVNHGISFIPQGVSADLIATIEGFTRRDVDQFAVESQKKAAVASREGRFSKSMIPIVDENGVTVLDHDEFIKEGTTLDKLSNLRPSFEAMGAMGFDDTARRRYPEIEKIRHIHHAGNSSGIVDGAALLLIGDKEKGEAMGMKPRAKFRSLAVVGAEPTIMLTGPTPATEKALKKAGLIVRDIDLFEINEAFAAVVIKAQRDLKLDETKINVNGGAIAMGHPLGATGAIILNTLLDELERQDKQIGLATLCVGGGMGVATIIERI